MQNIKDFTRIAKYTTLCNLLRKQIVMIYSGEDLPNGVVAPAIIKGTITKVNEDRKTFRFDFENPKSSDETNVLLQIDEVEAFEV